MLEQLALNQKSIDNDLDAALHRAAVIDRSEFGRVEITGRDALDLLHRLSTNDLLASKPGSVISTVFTTDKGRIVDLVRLGVLESGIIGITSPARGGPLIEWVNKYCIMEDAKFRDVTSMTGMVSLIGPDAPTIIGETFSMSLPPFTCADAQGMQGSLKILRDQSFGVDIIDIISSKDAAAEVKEALRSRAVEMSGPAYTIFRIARGMPVFGAELTSAFNPYEAGLRSAISFSKGCYLGQEVIARLDTYDKIQRKLVGLEFHVLPPPMQDVHHILRKDSSEVGRLTSISDHRTHSGYLGLGIVRKEEVRAGDTVWVDVPGTAVSAVVKEIPITLDLTHET